MLKRSRKKSRDPNQLAASIVRDATEETPQNQTNEDDLGKNPAAVALGKLGGQKGGRMRAERLTSQQRTEIARNAALARWRKKK